MPFKFPKVLSQKTKQYNFEKLYQDTNKKIFNYINKRVSTREDAEDLTSVVFEKVYKNISDFKWQGVNIESWIYTIARNTIIDYHRKYSKEKGQVNLDKVKAIAPDETKELLASLLDAEDEYRLYHALSKLKPDSQYLIYYKYFEELSNSEIAERMKLTETNVGTKLYRLRKKLIKLIENEKNNTQVKK